MSGYGGKTDLAGRAGGEASPRVGVGGVPGGRGRGAVVGLVGVTGQEHCGMGAAKRGISVDRISTAGTFTDGRTSGTHQIRGTLPARGFRSDSESRQPPSSFAAPSTPLPHPPCSPSSSPFSASSHASSPGPTLHSPSPSQHAQKTRHRPARPSPRPPARPPPVAPAPQHQSAPFTPPRARFQPYPSQAYSRRPHVSLPTLNSRLRVRPI